MLDTHISVETPEGIELQLIPAGPIPRIIAFIIDWTIKMSILIVFSTLFGFLDEAGIGMYLILYFLLEWFYGVLFEMLQNGMTPGKKLMKIQVMHDNGTPLSWGASILRNILRAADFFPFAYSFGIISMLSSSKFKRLGDHVAATMVVYKQNQPARITPNQSGSRPPPIPLELNEQQAFLAFAERSNKLTASRQQELANILEHILPNKDESRVQEIRKIANGILGQS